MDIQKSFCSQLSLFIIASPLITWKAWSLSSVGRLGYVSPKVSQFLPTREWFLRTIVLRKAVETIEKKIGSKFLCLCLLCELAQVHLSAVDCNCCLGVELLLPRICLIDFVDVDTHGLHWLTLLGFKLGDPKFWKLNLLGKIQYMLLTSLSWATGGLH